MNFKSIGVIHTPFESDEEIPFQVHRSEEIGEVEIDKDYEDALKDIEGFSHIIVIYFLHKKIEESEKDEFNLKSNGLTVSPYLDDEEHGTFATRSPNRPNPIGISILELLNRDENVLEVRGVDMFDETPVLDVKPYIPKFDKFVGAKSGWLEENGR